MANNPVAISGDVLPEVFASRCVLCAGSEMSGEVARRLDRVMPRHYADGRRRGTLTAAA